MHALQQQRVAAGARHPAAVVPRARVSSNKSTSNRRRSGRRRSRDAGVDASAASAASSSAAGPPPPTPPPPAPPLPPDLQRAWTSRAPTEWHPLQGPNAWQGTEDDAFEGASPLAALSRAQRLLLLSDGSVTRHLQIVLSAAGGSVAGSPSQGGSNDVSSSSSSKSTVRVECLAMDLLPEVGGQPRSQEALPPPERDALELLRPPLLRRQVLLRAAPGAAVPPAPSSAGRALDGSGADERDGDEEDEDDDDATKGVALVYAASWWNASDAAAYLGGGPGAAERPIWAALTSGRLELHRRVLGVERGSSARLWSPSGCLERGLLGGEGGSRSRGRGSESAAAAADVPASPSPHPPPQRALWGRHYVFWAGGRPLTVIYEVFSPRLMEAVDAACRVGG